MTKWQLQQKLRMQCSALACIVCDWESRLIPVKARNSNSYHNNSFTSAVCKYLQIAIKYRTQVPNMKICISASARTVLSTPPLCLTNCSLLRISVLPYKGSSKKKHKLKNWLLYHCSACYIYLKLRVCKPTPVFAEQTTNQERTVQFMEYCKMNHNHLFMEEV